MSDQAFIFWFIVLGVVAFASFVHFAPLDQRPEGELSPGRQRPRKKDEPEAPRLSD